MQLRQLDSAGTGYSIFWLVRNSRYELTDVLEQGYLVPCVQLLKSVMLSQGTLVSALCS